MFQILAQFIDHEINYLGNFFQPVSVKSILVHIDNSIKRSQ